MVSRLLEGAEKELRKLSWAETGRLRKSQAKFLGLLRAGVQTLLPELSLFMSLHPSPAHEACLLLHLLASSSSAHLCLLVLYLSLSLLPFPLLPSITSLDQ